MIRDVVDKQVAELKKLWANKRQFLFQALNLAMIVFSALMIWKVIRPHLSTNLRSPRVCVRFASFGA